MTSPTVGTKNENSAAASFSCTVTLTNAPSAGGIVVVLAAIYAGSGGGTWSCTNSGGTGVTITTRYDPAGSTDGYIGVLIYTVEYSTAPTSITVGRSGSHADAPYMSVCCVNVSGQSASYLDGCNGSTGVSSTPVATALPDLTDASDLVIGVMTRTDADGTTMSPGTNWTQITEIDEANATYQALNAIQRTPGATGSYDPTWALGGSPGTGAWRAAGISIKGASGGGGTIKRWVPQMQGGMRNLTGGMQ
jgi:hypothetical protein